MKVNVDHIMFKQTQISNESEVIQDSFVSFKKNRDDMITDVVNIKEKLIQLDDHKVNEKDAAVQFQKMVDQMKSNKEFSDLIRNDLLTLENYVERYYPIKMIKTI